MFTRQLVCVDIAQELRLPATEIFTLQIRDYVLTMSSHQAAASYILNFLNLLFKCLNNTLSV